MAWSFMHCLRYNSSIACLTLWGTSKICLQTCVITSSRNFVALCYITPIILSQYDSRTSILDILVTSLSFNILLILWHFPRQLSNFSLNSRIPHVWRRKSFKTTTDLRWVISVANVNECLILLEWINVMSPLRPYLFILYLRSLAMQSPTNCALLLSLRLFFSSTLFWFSCFIILISAMFLIIVSVALHFLF